MISFRSLKNAVQLARNMGLRYVAFRAGYEIERRSGFLKKRFPVQPAFQEFISLADWKSLPVRFFTFPESRLDPAELTGLKSRVQAFRRGCLTFFSSQEYEVKDWLTNPATGYRYDTTKHWTEIPDFSPEAGDIKYVWEKSRFAFLYDLIRYDHHFREDMSETVFSEIDSWIDENPINCGPNWRCSQEISLRVLNWTFALHYYRDSPALTPKRFARIIHNIYWQILHVEANIQFSRKAVRNNHALTETLTLYLAGLLFPFFPASTRWKEKGKHWFEQEVAYQIYEDGTFLQFSMNYHRVVVQLLSWGIQLAHLNEERWADLVYERARSSLHFLRVCQDATSGWLSNYGNNDGALFFPLNECHFRDYRPQLNALAEVLGEAPLYEAGKWSEDSRWLGITPTSELASTILDGVYSFDLGGYYIQREGTTLTFLRCGKYQDRPFQADNLHLDIWVNGVNILRDAGSYLYNTDERWTRYFAGTAAHNTITVGEFDQMRKGSRFIWYDWIRKSTAGWFQNSTCVFEGEFTGFRQSGHEISHRRRVTKLKGKAHWIVEDWLHNAPESLPLRQLWHPDVTFLKNYCLSATNAAGQEIPATYTEGWYSEKYGQKEVATQVIFTTTERYLKTEIKEITLDTF